MVQKSEKQKAGDSVVARLREALTNRDAPHEPWTSGVINLSGPGLTLLYERQDGTASPLKLGLDAAAQVEDLSNACQPATFGLNQEDVFDETYRKAGKLDAGKFLWGFNPDTGDFTSKLASGLFPWGSLHKGIRFELYNLNVYGKGSFFKPHQDTPRSEDMFGSLVVLLPFDHEGGNLLLRHNGHEYNFDGFALLKDVPSVSAAYIAFFGDVEHEVAQVTSGYRVTVTYNLYFDPEKGVPVTQIPRELEHPFKTALRTCLDNATTQPLPQCLGFGLSHAYPIQSALSDSKSLDLKGSDVNLIQTLNELKIKHHFFLLYRESNNPQRHCPIRVLSKVTVDGIDESNLAYECSFRYIAGRKSSFLVWDKEVAKNMPAKWGNWEPQTPWYYAYRYDNDKERYKSMDVKWVTEPKEEFLDRDSFMAYGNQSALGFCYHQLCVVAIIPQAGEEVAPVEVPDGDAVDKDEEKNMWIGKRVPFDKQ